MHEPVTASPAGIEPMTMLPPLIIEI
jgi:hypothetical protein